MRSMWKKVQAMLLAVNNVSTGDRPSWVEPVGVPLMFSFFIAVAMLPSICPWR